MYVNIDRAAGGAAVPAAANMSSGDLLSDTAYVLCTRGSGDRLHWRDGTVQDDQQTVRLGSASPGVDRWVDDTTADGSEGSFLTNFDYVLGSGQLLVVVGGIVQELDRHYTETAGSPGEVEFDPEWIPGPGERVVFINLNGSQGPAGTASNLQQAYNESLAGLDTSVDITAGFRVAFRGSTTEVLQSWGIVGSEQNAYVKGSGEGRLASLLLGARNHVYVNTNRWVFRDTATNRAVLLDPASGLRFGTYDGATWTADGVGSDGAVRFAYFEVTCDAVNSTDIDIGAVIGATFKGALVWAYHSGQLRWYGPDIAVIQNSGGNVHITFDGVDTVTLAGTYVPGPGNPVGSSFQNQLARIVVFY
jgi:hypothetical protein